MPGKKGVHSPAEDNQPLSLATAGLTEVSAVPLDTEAILEWDTGAWIF